MTTTTVSAAIPTSTTTMTTSATIGTTTTTTAVGTATITTRTTPSSRPQLDVVRYSMANAIDEMDLDTILTELLELEDQLNSAASDQLVYGLPVLPKVPGRPQAPVPPSTIHAEPAQDKSVLDLRLASASSTALNQLHSTGTSCTSPDGDSAFGDAGSSGSSSLGSVAGGGGVRGVHAPLYHHAQLLSSSASHSQFFSAANSCMPSPTSKASFDSTPCSTDILAASSTIGGADDAKTRKIREALEKMREAKMKKIFIKVFLEDGATRGILVDERWTVRETRAQIADRVGVALTAEHAIVEECPDLHITRVYEDHEFTVENLEEWAADSKNKLHFRRVPDRYNLIERPQEFLVQRDGAAGEPDCSPSACSGQSWDQSAGEALFKRLLNENTAGAASELEGWLLLKVDGRKSWRRHYFVLRSSGLYYNPKCGKKNHGVKDLQCLMNVYNNQVYMGVGWRKKYKAPAELGFAIKHPRIQVKTSKYIKYICAEDEATLNRWIAALRVVKNGFKQLYENYLNAGYRRPATVNGSTPNFGHSSAQSLRVDVPDVSGAAMRLSAATLGFDGGGSVSRISDTQSNCVQLRSPFNGGASLTPPQRQFSMGIQPTNGLVESLAHSNANLSRECSPSGAFFDQEECGTIKRQPPIPGSFATPPSAYGGPNPVRPIMHAGQEDDRDSDEADIDEDDQLPPPPVQCTISATPTAPPLSRKVPPPPPPRSTNTTPRTPQQHQFLPQQQQMSLSQPHKHQQQQFLPQQQTQVQDLYAELQKATQRQKQKIEQS